MKKNFKKVKIPILLTIQLSLIILLVFVNVILSSPVSANETYFLAENKNIEASISPLKTNDKEIWINEVGHGFRKGTQIFGLGAGATYGLLIFGSDERHHLAFGQLTYGRMLGGLKGADRWYSGNWELQVELFGGGQYNSESAYVVGLMPHLRYHFATGSRWVPFIDAGFGVSLTDISVPDLGGMFQFNSQLGVGVQWFVKDDMAVTCKGLYMHMSSAGLSMPNDGVNTVGVVLGVAWYF